MTRSSVPPASPSGIAVHVAGVGGNGGSRRTTGARLATVAEGLAFAADLGRGPWRVGVHVEDGEAGVKAPTLAILLAEVAHPGQILISQATTDAAGALPGVELVSHGAHRMRDLLTRVTVWEAVPAGRPAPVRPVRSLDAYPNNLPALVDRFIGRAHDLARIEADLRGGVRLATLTGPGGMGKTRLALHAAARLVDEFPDGAWFVNLAPLQLGSQADHAVISALGLDVEGDGPARQQVIEALRGSRTLVVLDNCEHVLGPVGDLVAALLAGCPGVAVLATSRRALRLPGERLWEVSSLSAEGDGAALFADRAAAVGSPIGSSDGEATLVNSLCRRLDGMPLAIELATARLRSLSVAELAARIDHRFVLLRAEPTRHAARHSGLDTVLQWSHSLLDSDQRQLLDRLSVFAGGFDLAAAHRVAGLSPHEVETLALLHELVDHSMVQAEQRDGCTRYRLLETVRQYGLDRLDPAEASAARRRHAEHFAEQLSTRHAPRGDRLVEEADNLRAAVQYAVEVGDPALALGITGRLWSPVYQELRPVEAEEWARAALDIPGARDHPDTRWAELLLAAVRFLWADFPGVERHARAALDAEAQLGLPPEPRVRLFLVLGLMFQNRQREAEVEALRAAEQAAAMGRAVERVEALYDVVQCCVADDRDADPAVVEACRSAAASLSSPVADVMARYTEAVAALRHDPGRAVALMAETSALAEPLGMHIFAEACRAYGAAFAHPEKPRLAVRGLADTLDRLRSHKLPFGLRVVVRDFLPAFAQLDAHETVAVLDGASGPLAMAPARAAAAIEEARHRLGAGRYDSARRRGRTMRLEDLEAFVRAELGGLEDGAPGGPSVDEPLARLTSRELDVADAVAGASNAEIAGRLFMSTRTVESHLTHIYRKLGIRSRTQLTALVHRQRA